MRMILEKTLFSVLLVGLMGIEIEARGFDKTLKDPRSGLAFVVHSHVVPLDHSDVTVRVRGSGTTAELHSKLDYATVDRAEIADLDGDGNPELYLFTLTMGNGGYQSLLGFTVRRDGHAVPIRYREPDDNAKVMRGYRGFDEYFIVGNALIRRFPIYRKEDPDCCPTGGHRLLYYRLIHDAKGWSLRLDRTEDRT